jgi:ankyrin repeat protein
LEEREAGAAADAGGITAAVIALRARSKADWSIKDKDSLTPLALAVRNKRTEVVQLLREHGAKE